LDRNSKVEKEVLIDDASGRVRDEMTFIVGKTLEIGLICLEVDFLSSPDRSLRLLIHGPCIAVLNWKEVETTGVLAQDRLNRAGSGRTGGQRRVGRAAQSRTDARASVSSSKEVEHLSWRWVSRRTW
jgi:hypothetical protein